MNITKISFRVKPINNVSEGMRHKDFGTYFISPMQIPLKKLTEEKEIFLVDFNRMIIGTEYMELLAKEGLMPCAPNYLLGLMAQIREYDMPKELEYKNIIACSSVFDHCFLTIIRRNGEIDRSQAKNGRELKLTYIDKRRYEDYIFLAEKTTSNYYHMSKLEKLIWSLTH